jgi:hypothetical protein
MSLISNAMLLPKFIWVFFIDFFNSCSYPIWESTSDLERFIFPIQLPITDYLATGSLLGNSYCWIG